MSKQTFKINEGTTLLIVFGSLTQLFNDATGRPIKKLARKNRTYIASSNSLEVKISNVEEYDDFKLRLAPPVTAQYDGNNFENAEYIEFSGNEMIIHYSAQNAFGPSQGDSTTPENTEEWFTDASDNEKSQEIKNLQTTLKQQEQNAEKLQKSIEKKKQEGIELQAELTKQEQRNKNLEIELNKAKETYESDDKVLLEYHNNMQMRIAKLSEKIKTSTKDIEDDLHTIGSMGDSEFISLQELHKIENEYKEIKPRFESLYERLRLISVEAANKGDQRTTELTKEKSIQITSAEAANKRDQRTTEQNKKLT